MNYLVDENRFGKNYEYWNVQLIQGKMIEIKKKYQTA